MKHGWPLTFMWRCYKDHYDPWGYQPVSRWPLSLKLWQLTAFKAYALILNVLIGLFILFSTGYATERSTCRRANPWQFSLWTALMAVVVVAVMCGTLASDPSLWHTVDGILVWLLSPFIGIGVACTMYTLAISLPKLVRYVSPHRQG